MACAVKMRLFSGIQVTEILVGIGEVRDRKLGNISIRGRRHNSGSLDAYFQHLLTMRTQDHSQAGGEKINVREEFVQHTDGQQRSSYASYVCDVHSGWW
jgi:hypothetical protein